MKKFLSVQNISQESKNKLINHSVMSIKHKSEIKINVGLDENKVPEELFWSADDGNIKDMEAKALLLSVWDSANRDTYKINLWTKEMPVNEMIQFFHQTLVSMADTFETATSDDKMSATMRDFCDYYAEKMGIK